MWDRYKYFKYVCHTYTNFGSMTSQETSNGKVPIPGLTASDKQRCWNKSQLSLGLLPHLLREVNYCPV